jgi:two-component system sensor histidine kinase VicK
VLTVRDTGVGIAPEHLNHLGERFYRVDRARSRQMGGAGLGLSIARGIAAAHHGSLTLTSVPELGTTATLSLPAATVAASPPNASSTEHTRL